jgi:hypothetical protein
MKAKNIVIPILTPIPMPTPLSRFALFGVEEGIIAADVKFGVDD